MSTRKRKQDEELVALPSDDSEEEEEYVTFYPPAHPVPQDSLNRTASSFTITISASQCDNIATSSPRAGATQPMMR